ncbi:MmpS family transport accessory protein [Plantactinospora sp. WMMB334]|uniref:MmpS family transport accessory protein n=1 Tax=Plantactinospora sp. WMMB334 TaxID=3404119 RepID=UPI003B93FB25
MRLTRATTALLTVVAVTLLACGSGGGDTLGPGAQGGDSAPAKGEKKILLEVTGAKSADITYGLGTDQSQEQGAKVPWKKELTSSEALLIVTLLAQNKGSGTIGCKITIDGEVVKENTSKGEFAVVTCNN